MHVQFLGLWLLMSVAVLAENQYGDHGMVLTALPFTADGFHNLKTYGLDFENFGQNELGAYTSNNPVVSYTSCAVDYDMNWLYVFDFDARHMRLVENFNTSLIDSELTWSNQHDGISQEHTKVVVDWISHNVYWTDAIHGWIAMQPGGPINNPAMYHVIIEKNLRLPRGLDIDPIDGFIFWTDAGNPSIERASLTGADRRMLLRSNLDSPASIVADHANKRLYFGDRLDIGSIDYDGNDRRFIARSSYGYFYDMALWENVLVTVDIGDYFVHFFDKNTGEVLWDKQGSDSEAFFGVCLYHSQVQPTPTQQDRCKNQAEQCSDICVNEPDQATCLCREDYVLDSNGKTCTEDPNGKKRFLLASSDTRLCTYDIRMLSKQHEAYTAGECFYEGPLSEKISHLDLNMRTREVYFSAGSIIYSIPIGGPASAKRIITQQTNEIVGLSYDYIDDIIYFAMKKGIDSMTPESIWTVQPGSNIVLEHKTETNGEVRGLVTAPHAQRVYWLAGDNLIEYSDLSMHNATDLKTLETDGVFIYASRIIHDVKYEVIHILDSDYGDLLTVHYNGTIDRYNILAENAVDVAVYKDFVMYIEHTGNQTTLKSADFFAGSPIQWMDFGTLGNIGNANNIMVFDLDTLQPRSSSPCINHNGGCQHQCYPRGDVAVCECSRGYKLNMTDEKSCIPDGDVPKDHVAFMADTTFNEIYALAYKTRNTGIVALSSPREGAPEGVTYDPTTEEIYWSRYDLGQIWKKQIDGPEMSLYLDTGFSYSSPRRLLRDPNSGYIYYTAESPWGEYFLDSYIGVVRNNGSQGFVMSDNGHIPSALAIHPIKGWLFWTDFGSENPSVNRADMDGKNPITIATEDVLLPNGLAIDYSTDRLYWTDGYYNKIYSSLLDGSDRVVFLEDEKAHLMDLVLLDGYLYYTSWNNPHITKVNINNPSDKTNLLLGAGLGRMTALFMYSSTATNQIPVTTVCDDGNHRCSHFCFPTPTGYGCGCEEYQDMLSNGYTCENAPRCSLYAGESEVAENMDTCLRVAGDRCNFTCNNGYQRRVQGLLRCTSNTNDEGDLIWEPSDPCEEILCPATISHGALHENCTRSIGEDCHNYTCATGYEKNPDVEKLVCNPDGTWAVSDTLCKEKCPPISSAVEHALFVGPCARDPGTSCRFACDPKWKYASAVETISCGSPSTWNVDTRTLCEQIRCPDIIPNGHIKISGSSCNRLVDTECSYECADRFDPHPIVRRIKCGNKGTWTTGNATLCTPFPTPPEKQSQKAIAVGVGIGIGGVVLVIIILALVLFCMCRKGMLVYGGGSAAKSPPAVAFENPRYHNGDVEPSASGAGSEYTMSDGRYDDKADLTKESWSRTMAGQGVLHVYDNPTRVVQP